MRITDSWSTTRLQQIGASSRRRSCSNRWPATPAPAIAAAALWLLARDPDAVMLVQPSDHVIASLANFHGAVMRGLAAAQQGRLVTFGVKPSRPETGYGYIQSGKPVDGADGVFSVDRFVEKPDREAAQRFVDSGAFFWNSGIFLLSARAYLGELSRINPAMLGACERAVRDGKEDLTFFRLCADSFAEAPELSIDHAVMEHTTRAAVVPVDMAWSDVGSWPALRSVGRLDDDGNILQGDVLTERVHNSYIRSEGQLVAAIGLDNVVVVATDDAVLVADADSAAEVSGIVSRLRGQNRPESQQHATCHRPWGHYRTVDAGERFQVKRITVKPGAKLSLQKHYHR
jgi:mannose-1-phosphate guanylyltransferase/mannose-6-phosphate isomerase